MEEDKLITLKLVGFNEESRNGFAAVLTLAGRALKKKWQITETEEADFFLLSLKSSATANRDRLLKGLFADRCLFCSTENITQENELLVDANHVPRLSVLAALLNKFSADVEVKAQPKVTDVSGQAATTANTAAANSEDFFDPQTGLLGHLLANQNEPLIVSLNNQPQIAPLYIDPKKGIYFSKNSLPQLDAYLTTSEDVLIKSASKVEIKSLITAESLKPLPLKDLIWYIVMKTSLGKPIKGFSTANDIVALKIWPDLRLFKCMDYAKVATFMKNNAAPLETIAAHTEMPLQELINFYNACHLAGLIERREHIEINKKTLSPERVDLLNKIDARLK